MSQNEDNEPRIHTVISLDSNNSSTFYDSIAFSIPRREEANAQAQTASASNVQSPIQEIPYCGDPSMEGASNNVVPPTVSMYDTMSMSMLADDLQSGENVLKNTPHTAAQGHNYPVDPQGFYNNPSQPPFVYENRHDQPVFYENEKRVTNPHDYQHQRQRSSHMLNISNQPDVSINAVQTPYADQTPLLYEVQPQQVSYNNQPLPYQNIQNPTQGYENQQDNNIYPGPPPQMGYNVEPQIQSQPQQVYDVQYQELSNQPPDFLVDGPYQSQSRLAYDAGNQAMSYGTHNQEFLPNQNPGAYNEMNQQPQIPYAPPEHGVFELSGAAAPPIQTPALYNPLDSKNCQYPDVVSDTQIVDQLEKLEIGVEAANVDILASTTPAFAYDGQMPVDQMPLFETVGRYAPTIVTDSTTNNQPIHQTLEMFTPPSEDHTPIENFSQLYTSADDDIYDMWIPLKETRNILLKNGDTLCPGTYFPDNAHVTTPAVIYEDDLVDKVAVNMSRIFGESEACKRKILTADSVTQDDAGLRELIKLGCYRSAINLTKRLLTLYGQGPGKIGHYSKQTPHSLQLWFTRISLLMRIREFSIAESEIAAYKNFDNPDLYYEYYADTYGQGRKGSMVPFHFRLLASEVSQYVRKFNDTANGLNHILFTIQKILKHLEKCTGEEESSENSDKNIVDEIKEELPDSDLGKSNNTAETETDELPTPDKITAEKLENAIAIWKSREIRTLYALVNASLFAKDYYNAFTTLLKLCEKDIEHLPQLKSAIGRLFLQHGDLSSAQNYFLEAAELRSTESDTDRVENLIDSALSSIANSAYPEAYVLFQQALQIQPENFMVTNNMAVCLLYMGKVKDALALMESTVKQNTPQLLQENVILNLSTIYELENSDGYKKNSLLKLISEYKGDGINLASLKMPNLI